MAGFFMLARYMLRGGARLSFQPYGGMGAALSQSLHCSNCDYIG